MPININSSVIARLDAVDPDRMRAARLADPDVRDRLFALYAFHAELAKIPELVSEPLMGQIRYQWWRDCLNEIYGAGQARAHEVSTPLAEMVAQCGISRFLLDRIIDGRERDLDPTPFSTIKVAMDYADATSGALAQAAVMICGGEGWLIAGRAWGLTGLARSYRYYADGMLSEVSFDDLLTATLEAYSEARSEAPKTALPALAYVSLVPGFIKRMSRRNYDAKIDVPNYAPFKKQLKLLGTVVRGRI
ncbi:MAG: squalene/phytoene synthase family protein [Litorimonas sp.]